MKKSFIILGLLSIGFTYAQSDYDGRVGININEPEATIDIKAYKPEAVAGNTKNEGILIPRVTKERVKLIEVTQRKEGTLVYVTDVVEETDNGTFTGTGKGFYYYDQTTDRWIKMGVGNASNKVVPYQNIRGNVTLVDDTYDYTIKSDDFLVETKMDKTTIIRFPATSEAEKGRVIHIFNNNTVSGGLKLEGNFTGQNTTNQRRGRTFVSDGTTWIGVAL